jgi:hypothetical protein
MASITTCIEAMSAQDSSRPGNDRRFEEGCEVVVSDLPIPYARGKIKVKEEVPQDLNRSHLRLSGEDCFCNPQLVCHIHGRLC